MSDINDPHRTVQLWATNQDGRDFYICSGTFYEMELKRHQMSDHDEYWIKESDFSKTEINLDVTKFCDELRNICNKLTNEERKSSQENAMSIIYTGVTREEVKRLKDENKLWKQRNKNLKLYLKRWLARDLFPKDSSDPLSAQTETVLKWG